LLCTLATSALTGQSGRSYFCLFV